MHLGDIGRLRVTPKVRVVICTLVLAGPLLDDVVVIALALPGSEFFVPEEREEGRFQALAFFG